MADSCCENCGWSETVGTPIMCNFNGHRTFRDEICPAWKPKKDINENNEERIYTREVLIQIIEEALDNKQRPEESDEFSFWTDLLSYLKGGEQE